jgi:hypothetical protein
MSTSPKVIRQVQLLDSWQQRSHVPGQQQIRAYLHRLYRGTPQLGFTAKLGYEFASGMAIWMSSPVKSCPGGTLPWTERLEGKIGA